MEQLFARSGGRTGAIELRGARAFVVPHAGPEYSGTVAAAAYQQIARSKPERIAVLGFSHFMFHQGVLIPDVDAYRTPLGEIAVDRGERNALLGSKPFSAGDPRDHSVEIQLPFLQFALGNVSVLPLYVGQLEESELIEAAHLLGGLMRTGYLFVASTDLTHYGASFGYLPFPVDAETPERLRALDQEIIEAIATLDRDRFHAVLRDTGSTMCGYLPVALLMEVLRTNTPDFKQTLLDYQTSGEITSDYAHCVSYAALAYSHASLAN